MPIYKDKKRNTWYFRTYVTDKNGERIQKSKSGFKTKSDCKNAENNFLLNYIDKNDDILFIDLYNIYMKNKKQSLKYQSYKTLKNRIDNHILPFFKDYKMNNIKANDIIEWKNYIISKNNSYIYNSSLYKVLVSLFNFAIAFYDLNDNIVKKIGNFARVNYSPNINFWSFEEFNKFISNFDDIVFYSLFDLLYYSGLRLGEALALNWNDLQNSYINVTKTLLKSSIDNPMFNAPKTQASIRKVKIDNNVLNNLNKLKSYYQQFYYFNNDWFIFGGIKPLSRTTIERKKNYYCKIANVKQIRMHDFRHSHASFLLSKGVPITVISKRLGHSNIAMTLNRYSHLMLDDEDKAVDLLNKLKS